MTKMPDALVAALENAPAASASRHSEVTSSRVRRGDLRLSNGLPGQAIDPRLVLVLSVDGGVDFAEVLLAHTAIEMACEVDVVVSTAVSRAPYDVVVEADLRGVVWTLQLGPTVGRLDEDVLSALGARTPDADTYGPPGAPRGLRLAGPDDPRWGFKRDEGEAFRALTNDCTEALLDDGSWVVEPGLLRPELLDLADDRAAIVTELMHWFRTRSLEIGPAEIEMLLERGALDVDAWAAVDDLGLDIWTAIQSLVEDSATAAREPEMAGPLRLVSAAHLEISTRSVEPVVVRYLGRKEPAAA